MHQFPSVELSYETIPHRKVSSDYNICMAIAVGKKCFLWYTFYNEHDVCFLIELNRDKKPAHMYLVSDHVSNRLAHGTILHGTWLDGSVECMGINAAVHVPAVTHTTASPVFLIDDVLYYRGRSIKNYMTISQRKRHRRK
jgi:hypothetical protein